MIRMMLAAAFLTLIGGAAFAAEGEQCGPAAKVIAGLQSQYGEAPTFTGTIGTEGGAVTFTTSPKGTWTMLVAKAPDQLCIIAAGEQWQTAAPSADAPKAAPGNLPDAPALLEHGLILIRQ